MKEDEGKSIDQVDQSLENGGGGEKIAEVNEEDIVVVPRQQTDPVFGVLMAAISFVFAYAGLALQGFGYILLWPAIDFFLLSWAYCFKGSSGHVLMGKNEETGQIGWANFLLFLPWHALYYASWRIKHLLRGEHVYDSVGHGMYVGRLPIHFPEHFPVDCQVIVDLTGEMSAVKASLKGRRYYNAGCIDRLMPDPVALEGIARTLLKEREDVGMYIHCANGHGRSGVFAAIMLVSRGVVEDLDDAKKYLKEKRAVINWQEHQQDVGEEVLMMLKRHTNGGHAAVANRE